VTTNNDTPQVFSDGTSEDGPFGGEWRDQSGAAPYGSWFGWDEREQAGGQPGEPEYPSGPGFAPLPADEPGYPGYPAGPGYAHDSGYPHDLGYPYDGWNVPGAGQVRRAPEARYPGYAPEPGYGRAAGVPPMESLPGKRSAAGSGPGPAGGTGSTG
jgi:hypothetical protein